MFNLFSILFSSRENEGNIQLGKTSWGHCRKNVECVNRKTLHCVIHANRKRGTCEISANRKCYISCEIHVYTWKM